MFNVRIFLSDPEDFYQRHPLIIWRSIILEVCIAFLSVIFLHLILAKKQGIRIREVSLWHQLFTLNLPNESTIPQARVKLKNGSVYVGLVVDYTPDFEMANREIVLGPPFYSKPKHSKV